MRIKKILALLLATLMLVGALVSCGSAYDTPTDYLTLPGLDGVTVKWADILEKIEENIKDLREGAAGQVFEPLTDKDATVQKGDQVYFSFKGTSKTELKEAVQDQLSGDHQYLTIGSDSSTFPVDYTNKNDDNKDNDKDDETVLVKGFESQLIGAKVGDKLTITAKFPSNHTSEDLRNVEVTYEVEIKAIARVSVTKDFKVKISYTVTDDKTKVEDILVPVITTEAPDTSATPDSTAAPDTTAAPTTTEAPGTTEEPDFEDLFPDKKDVELDLANDGKKVFCSIFEVNDIIRYLEGKGLYSEFAIAIPVPEDYKDEKYAEYRGKEIYFTITVNSTTATPEWTDYFVNRYTSQKYETKADYEKYLEEEYRKTVAYDTIYKLATIKEYPYDEWKDSYEGYVEVHLLEFLKEEDNLKTTPSLSDYTPAELKAKVSDADYDAIRTKATYSARTAIKQRLTMEALFKQLDITLSRKEYKEKMKEAEEDFETNMFYYYINYGIATFDQFVSYNGGKEYYELQFRYEKLLEKLPEVVKYEEKPSTAD